MKQKGARKKWKEKKLKKRNVGQIAGRKKKGKSLVTNIHEKRPGLEQLKDGKGGGGGWKGGGGGGVRDEHKNLCRKCKPLKKMKRAKERMSRGNWGREN